MKGTQVNRNSPQNGKPNFQLIKKPQFRSQNNSPVSSTPRQNFPLSATNKKPNPSLNTVTNNYFINQLNIDLNKQQLKSVSPIDGKNSVNNSLISSSTPSRNPTRPSTGRPSQNLQIQVGYQNGGVNSSGGALGERQQGLLLENSQQLDIGSLSQNSVSGGSKNIGMNGPNSVRGGGSLQQPPSYLTGSRRVNTPKQGLAVNSTTNRDLNQISIPSATNSYTNNTSLLSGGMINGGSSGSNNVILGNNSGIGGGNSVGHPSSTRGVSPQVLLGQLRDTSNSRQQRTNSLASTPKGTPTALRALPNQINYNRVDQENLNDPSMAEGGSNFNGISSNNNSNNALNNMNLRIANNQSPNFLPPENRGRTFDLSNGTPSSNSSTNNYHQSNGSMSSNNYPDSYRSREEQQKINGGAGIGGGNKPIRFPSSNRKKDVNINSIGNGGPNNSRLYKENYQANGDGKENLMSTGGTHTPVNQQYYNNSQESKTHLHLHQVLEEDSTDNANNVNGNGGMLPHINSYNNHAYREPGNINNNLGIGHTSNSREASGAQEDTALNSEGAIELSMRFSFRTRRGYMPTNPNQQNQDACIITNNINKKSWQHFFSVCDGHGVNGHHVSGYLKNNFPNLIANNPDIQTNPRKGLNDVFETANYQLVNESGVDLSFSGTTVVSIYFHQNSLFCANVGDSRAIIGKKVNDRWSVIPLSRDHKPSDQDEAPRIIQQGGRIEAFKDQEGKPIGPLRVWLQEENVPGLAMTRSMGDLVAASVGVSWKPEIIEYQLSQNDQIIVIGSDGLWEFIENKEIIKMVAPYYQRSDLEGACECLLQEAYLRWTRECNVIDDITFTVIFMNS